MLYLGVPVCKECGSKFPNWAVVEGCKRNLQKRHYCLTCSPYGKREKNLRPLLGIKHCPACNDDLPSSDFYVRSAPSRHGHLSPYCKKCSGLQVTIRQQQLKKLCVAYKGGKCESCGYDKCYASMDFHHRDPDQKDFSISSTSKTKWSEKLKLELDKCSLLCSNCHRELHHFEVVVPAPVV